MPQEHEAVMHVAHHSREFELENAVQRIDDLLGVMLCELVAMAHLRLIEAASVAERVVAAKVWDQVFNEALL